MVVYKCKTSKCMIKQIRSNFVYKKCFINVSIELPCRTWIFLKMVTKPKLTNIIKILHFLWKQIVLRFLMQFYKVFQSEEELEQIRAYLVFYDHCGTDTWRYILFKKNIYIHVYTFYYNTQGTHRRHLELFKTVTSAGNFPWN